jgi:putative glutamine amidotransferase
MNSPTAEALESAAVEAISLLALETANVDRKFAASGNSRALDGSAGSFPAPASPVAARSTARSRRLPFLPISVCQGPSHPVDPMLEKSSVPRTIPSMDARSTSSPRIGLTTTKPESDKFANYARAVERAGGTVVPLVPGKTDAKSALGDLDALILTGGGDVDPEVYGQAQEPEVKDEDIHAGRDALELALAREVQAKRIPALCICRGMQVLNVALRGTLIQHLPKRVGDRVPHVGSDGKDGIHPVDVAPASHLAKVLGTTRTSPNSSHHQAIDRLADGLRVVARSPDDGIIEAVEGTDHPWLIGVQWHPERSSEPCQQRLFDELVRAAREARAKNPAATR